MHMVVEYYQLDTAVKDDSCNWLRLTVIANLSPKQQK